MSSYEARGKRSVVFCFVSFSGKLVLTSKKEKSNNDPILRLPYNASLCVCLCVCERERERTMMVLMYRPGLLGRKEWESGWLLTYTETYTNTYTNSQTLTHKQTAHR